MPDMKQFNECGKLLTRKSFLGSLASCGAFAALAPWDALADTADTRVLRFGVMSDTHVGKTYESCWMVRNTIDLFKREGCELVINNGDIADWHYPTGYEALRRIYDEAYAGQVPPQEIWIYAWHDVFNWKGHPRSQVRQDVPACWPDVKRQLRIPHNHTDKLVIKGYTFLVFPQWLLGRDGFPSVAEYEKAIADACAANPDKPVFIVDHIPPRDTSPDSKNWGDAERRRVLDKYPQVIQFAGHTHGDVRSDLQIWQGNFTVVNAGCQNRWSAGLAANPDDRHSAYSALTVDVCPDRLVIRRWDIRNQAEVAEPWIVPLPFAAASAPWNRAHMRTSAKAPVFPAGADLAIAASRNSKGFLGFEFSFPEASSAERYRLEAQVEAAGEWKPLVWLEILGQWNLPPAERKARLAYVFPEAYFEPSKRYRFTVTPIGSFGQQGSSLTVEARSPADFPSKRLVWSCAEPMSELAYVNGCDVGRMEEKRWPVGDDGFYGPANWGINKLKLPEGLFAGEEGTRFRLTADITTDQKVGGSPFALKLVPRDEKGDSTSRLPTPSGKNVTERYIIELTKDKRHCSDTYDLGLNYGVESRIRFHSFRLEELPK